MQETYMQNAATKTIAKDRRTPARASSARKPSAKSTLAVIREAVALVEAAPVLEVIETKRNAHGCFERAVDATDDVMAKQERREITAADKAEWREAERADAKALRQLVRTRPTTVKGLRALIQYSMDSFREQGWDDETMLRLLASIMESAPLRLKQKAA
jgi:hypothetical protein